MRWFILIAMLSVAGCRSISDDRPGSADDRDVGVPEAGLAVMAAYRSGDTLHIQGSLDGEPFIGRVSLAEVPRGSGTGFRTLVPVTRFALAGPESAVHSVALRSTRDWTAVLASAFDRLAPRVADRGVVIEIGEQEELFVYRDEFGHPISVPLNYKPASVRIDAVVGFDRFLVTLGEQLTHDEYGRVQPPAVLLATGDDDPDGIALVYADTTVPEVVFLRWMPAEPASGLSAEMAVQATAHAVGGQLWSLVSHPASSLSRLFSLLAVSALDMSQPTAEFLLPSDSPPELRSPRPFMDTTLWEDWLDHTLGRPQTFGRIHYLVDGAAFFPRFTDVVSMARESLLLRLYIFDNDDYALRYADLFRRRSQDLEVRVMLDGLGTLGGGYAQPSYRPVGHRPPPSIAAYLRENSRVDVRMLSNPWMTGDHTKVIVVDRELAYLGGMNIGREYRYDWHDMMVELEGPVVQILVDDFEAAWSAEEFLGDLRSLAASARSPPVAPREGDVPLRVLYTQPPSSEIYKTQLEAIRRSQSRIFLENAYLTSDLVLYELARARRRGVDVRVIMPYEVDSGLIDSSNVLAANLLIDNGVRVFVYPGMSHVKAAIYDGWACLGSANFDNLSLRVNKEANIATSDPGAVEALVEVLFAPDFERSVEMLEPLPENFGHYLAELIADAM